MRRFLATLLVVAVFATTFWLSFLYAPDAQAIKCGYETTYYSDATYTTQVGVETWLPQACGCFYSIDGTTTVYKITVGRSCIW